MKDYIKQFDRDSFAKHVAGKYFGSLPANKIVIHHTYRPTQATFFGCVPTPAVRSISSNHWALKSMTNNCAGLAWITPVPRAFLYMLITVLLRLAYSPRASLPFQPNTNADRTSAAINMVIP